MFYLIIENSPGKTIVGGLFFLSANVQQTRHEILRWDFELSTAWKMSQEMPRWAFELIEYPKVCSDEISSWTKVPRNAPIRFGVEDIEKRPQENPRNAPMRFGVEDSVLKLVKLANFVGGWWKVGEKLVSWSIWWKIGEVGEKLVKLVNLAGGWWSWWKVDELGEVGEFGEKLVKSWWRWWKVGEVGEKLVNLAGGLLELVKRGSEVRQVDEKLVKLVNLVTLRSGLSIAGDETVKWENCLRTHDTSSTPDTSVRRWGKPHILFDHYTMVKYFHWTLHVWTQTQILATNCSITLLLSSHGNNWR